LAKKKIPQIVKQIRKSPKRDIDYTFQKSISFSQFSTFQSCPRKWQLQYREGNYSDSSINMTFGTGLHETIQHYLTTMYDESIAAADRIDLEEHFEESFRKAYLKDYKSNKNVHFSNPEEMNEFFQDGIEIIRYLKKKKGSYFSKRGWHLIGCEVPILITPNPQYPNVLYKGYLDVVLYHEPTQTFEIIDIKTSTSSWNDKQKKDEIKQFQLILYKKFFAQQFNIPVDSIDVKFFIVKRKIWENSDFPIPRIQIHIPPSGKVKLNKATTYINDFISNIFNQDGTPVMKKFTATPSANSCKFCMFANKPDLCDKGVS
jgi:hypothetical protein